MASREETRLLALAELFAVEFHDLGGRLVAGDVVEAQRHASDFQDDPDGLEAFVNHFHLEDVLALPATSEAARQVLVELGRKLVVVWADRLKRFAPSREVLFYLGGVDTVSLRFHVDRKDGRSWLDLRDQAFMRRERVSVYRSSEGLRLEADFA